MAVPPETRGPPKGEHAGRRRERGTRMASKKTVAAATSRQTKAPPEEYASAMDKLRDEMAKSKDKYVEVVGEYLTDCLLAQPEAEAALLDKSKSIKGSLETVRKEAEKVKQGNMAILDDRTVFGIVLNYFGLKSEPDAIKTEWNVPKTGANVPGETTGETTSSDPPQAAAHLPLKGKAFGETGQDTPADPFDLDALLASGIAGLSPSDPQESPGETRDAKRGGALMGVI